MSRRAQQGLPRNNGKLWANGAGETPEEAATAAMQDRLMPTPAGQRGPRFNPEMWALVFTALFDGQAEIEGTDSFKQSGKESGIARLGSDSKLPAQVAARLGLSVSAAREYLRRLLPPRPPEE